MDFIKITQSLNKILESTNLSIDTVKKIFNTAYIDYEPDMNERVVSYTADTLNGSYPYYSVMYANESIMLSSDYNAYIKDLAWQILGVLPDGYADFFDADALHKAMKKDTYYVQNTVKFINKLDEDSDLPILLKLDEVEVDGVKYTIVENV